MADKKNLIAYYDIETNGFLARLDTCHSLVIQFSDGRFLSCADQPDYTPIATGIRELEKADIRVGQNNIKFDDPGLMKVYPWYRPNGRCMDTLVLSRLLFPDIGKHGPNNHNLMPKDKRSHSLRAWGLRLGEHKGDYRGGFDTWSEDMQKYCEQDVAVLVKLFKYLMAKKPDMRGVDMEHEFAALIHEQEQRGFAFDHPKALLLQARLQQREQILEASLIQTFGEWWEGGKKGPNTREWRSSYRDEQSENNEDEDQEELVNEVDAEKRESAAYVVEINKTRHVKLKDFPDITRPRFSEKTGKELKPYVGPPIALYEQGALYTPIKRVQFNPGSRDHVRKMLRQRYKWRPEKYTKKGRPVIDDAVLSTLAHKIPEAALLAEYYMLLKRLGQLATGRNSWLKLCVQEGKEWFIYGSVNTGGALGGRCTHSRPNVTQTPSLVNANGPVPYGREMRELWRPRRGYTLVGHDAAGLELRMLGHYLYPYDNGEYARIVADADPHAWTRDTIGTDLVGAGDDGRTRSKRIIYAYIFGAGNPKLGSIVEPDASFAKKKALGAEVKDALATRFVALGKLEEAVKAYAEEKGYIVGLDGRHVPVRKLFAILNTLLQGGGGLVMKRSFIELRRDLASIGWTFGKEFAFLANIHDEGQTEVLPPLVSQYKELAEGSVPKAGAFWNIRCKLSAEAKEGATWADTH